MAVASLTKPKQDAICGYLREGNSRATAARAAGVKPEDMDAWLKRAERAGRKFVDYRKFRDAVLQAEAQARATLVGTIFKASGKSWRAALWLLEHDAEPPKPEPPNDEDADGDEEEEPEEDDPIAAARDELAARRDPA